MMLAGASPPLPTPAPTLASAFGAVLAPRQTTDLYGYDTSCYELDGLVSCANILQGCYGDILKATDYVEAGNSCFCASGMPYLNCYLSALSTNNCYQDIMGTMDWNSYMLEYFYSTCGTIPPTAMAQMAQPTAVSLEFEEVEIVTATGRLEPPPQVVPPNYKGVGQLLGGECTETDFTLVDAGSTVYFAAFNGCNGERPQCCPWRVATSTESPPATTNAAGVDTANRIGFDFPQPEDNNLAVLNSCAEDYYSVSGGCCPVGYWMFTTDVGGQTPCYSSINRAATPPTLTAGLAANPADTSKPTSAVVNIVWSMRYPVADQKSGLSTAALAGIGAGAGVVAILIGVLAICLWKSHRRNKRLEEGKLANGGQGAPMQPTPQKLPNVQQAAIPNGQFQQYLPVGSLQNTQTPMSMTNPSIMGNMSAPAPSPLIPQSTGTSNGAASELSAQSGQGLLQGGSYPGGTPSPATGSIGSPPSIAKADEGQGLQQGQQSQPQPMPHGYFYPQSLTPQHQSPHFPLHPAQQPPFYSPQPYYSPQGQMIGYSPSSPVMSQEQPYYGIPPQQAPFYPPQQMGHAQLPHQAPGPGPYYNLPQQTAHPRHPQLHGSVSEMSAQRETDPPQEIAGNQVR